MEEFAYLAVILAIVLGLAIAQVVIGFRGLLLSRARVRVYWPSVVWALQLLFIFVQTWWAMFGLRNHQDWTFNAFAVVLLQTILLYMLGGLIFPDFGGTEVVDLRKHYYAHHRWFFGIAVTASLVSLCKDLVLNGALPERTNLGFHLVYIVIGTIAVLTRREWYHKIMAIIGIAMFLSYTAMLFGRLR